MEARALKEAIEAAQKIEGKLKGAVSLTPGAELIAQERKRQIEVEHWTAEHDANYPAQMALAGAAYSICAAGQISGNTRVEPPVMWPWELRWWKPTEDPVRNLTKAGALIAAEIDRILAARQTN